MAEYTLESFTRGGNTYIYGGTDSEAMHKGVDYVTAGALDPETLGNNATAEGTDTESSGNYAHAEGVGATAAGEASHAEGHGTSAKGYQSHSEGWRSTTYGSNSHAEGYKTYAYGSNSHVEGNETVAEGISAHAEGESTRANGNYSHVEGYNSSAIGNSSHAEGEGTKAIGNNSHSEGYYTSAVGDYSHAAGISTCAQGDYQTVIGKYNEAKDDNYAFIIGNGTNQNRSNAFTVKFDGSLSSNLGNLNNVNIDNQTLVDGQVLEYNSTNNKWTNAAPSAGTVTDVQIDSTSIVSEGVANITTMTGAGASTAGAKGLVPAPASGDNEKFLRGDGTWAAAGGGGGTSDYTDLTNKPQVNGITLSGNKTSSDLGIVITLTQAQYDALSAADKADLSKVYYISDATTTATTVVPNPVGTATASLSKLQIGNTIYSIISEEYYDYILFTGASTDGHIILPWKVNSDYKITVVFDIPTYYSNNAIIGNSSSPNYTQLTAYSNKWYTGTGTSEVNFTDSLTGKHTFINNSNGKNYFDGTEVSTYSPQTVASAALLIGGRANATNLRGKIYEYKIESISTGETIEWLKPCKYKIGGFTIAEGLISQVTGDIYTCSGLSLGNDE